MSWTDAQRVFETTLPGYEPRTHQDNLARAIEEALAENAQILAQAGTGTGKSLAGLVPAIEFAREHDIPVVISTGTKALQTQYMEKDLPFLAEVLAKEMPFTYTALMGRSNYLCLAKLTGLDPDSIPHQKQLLEESETHPDGNIENLITEVDFRDRSKITSSSEECPGKNECPFGEVCFAQKAKERAQESDLVIVSHALLARDAQLHELTRDAQGDSVGILPDFGACVVDEAHELEDYVTGALGAELGINSFARFSTDLTTLLRDEMTANINLPAVRLFDELANRFPRNSNDRDYPFTDHVLMELEDEFFSLMRAMEDAQADLRRFRPDGNQRDEQRKKRLSKRASSLKGKLSQIIESDSSQLIRWVEKKAHRDGDGSWTAQIKFAPLHVGNFLRRNLWTRPAALLSATLAMGSDFSYITDRLGLDKPEKFDAGTPFDFPKQARLFVPSGMDPSADRQRWQASCHILTTELVRAAGGRALVLFTSTAAMNEAYAAAEMTLGREGYTLLKQGQMNTKLLAETFKTDEISVLFALKTFMTGIDVQGDALRLVIIDKLPFPVPTDVIFRARSEAIDAKARNKWVDGSFPKLSVPTMALTLLQALGRLIRTKSDEGLVAILDSRLDTKPYGRTMLRALPPATRVHSLDEAREYLAELETRRG